MGNLERPLYFHRSIDKHWKFFQFTVGMMGRISWTSFDKLPPASNAGTFI